MILTEHDFIFAKEGTDIVLDRLALKNVTFIGKVVPEEFKRVRTLGLLIIPLPS